jgi:hypothetical protein
VTRHQSHGFIQLLLKTPTAPPEQLRYGEKEEEGQEKDEEDKEKKREERKRKKERMEKRKRRRRRRKTMATSVHLFYVPSTVLNSFSLSIIIMTTLWGPNYYPP